MFLQRPIERSREENGAAEVHGESAETGSVRDPATRSFIRRKLGRGLRVYGSNKVGLEAAHIATLSRLYAVIFLDLNCVNFIP